MKKEIYYHHTDAGGVVYYGRYLDFLEEARTGFLKERGISVEELSQHGVLFVVRRQEIDYRTPSFYADTLQIDTELTKISKASLEFAYEVKNQSQKLVCSAKTVLACVNKNFKVIPIPENIRKKLSE